LIVSFFIINFILNYQFSAKKSAFFPGVDLLNFVCDFLGVNHPDVIMQNMGRYFDQMNKQIKGLFFR